MQLSRLGSVPTNNAPENTFTDDVCIGGYFRRQAPSQLAGAIVTFPSGSRTPWKVNPLGQTLIVTNGVGWAQAEGEQIVEIRTGDLIWFPPGQQHWEGATPDHEMTYIAIQEEAGRTVEFREKVSDEQYRQGPPASGS